MAVSTLNIVSVGLVCTYIFLRIVLHLTQDVREPPAIEKAIPFLSPMIGMIREKSRYYVRLRLVPKSPKELCPVLCCD